MKSSVIGRLALVLWVVTMVALAWFFIFGQTAGSGTDGRTIIRLQPAERDLVLKEMRSLLSATHGILQGISEQDLRQVSKEAHAVGMAAAADVNPALMANCRLPSSRWA
jgi:hypothetical protein